MSKKEKKAHFGKRLWDSITEPLPDDNDDQNNEQIPLAYDLKDSAASDAAKAAASTVASAAPESAKGSTVPESEDDVVEPIRIRRAHSEAAETPTSADVDSQAVDLGRTVELDPNAVIFPSSHHADPQLTAPADKATVDSSVEPKSAVADTPAPRVTDEPKPASSVAASETPISATVASSAPQVRERRVQPSQAATPNPPRAMPTNEQPKIAIHGTEQNDDQPELPLSREELYGDQQPNGGQEPAKQRAAAMSRVARHTNADDGQTTNDADHNNSHLKKKPDSGKPHQKAGHYNWKLMFTGIVILLIALIGGVFMWNRAKVTQADAKTNAETIVKAIYTSSAQRDLRASATSSQVQELQSNIDNMKSSSEKDKLQKQHDYAKKMMTVRTAYQKLRNVNGLINAEVTTATITEARQNIKSAGLTNSKAYFAKKYDQKLATTGKTVKKVISYDKAFKQLYNKKGKLKSSTPSSEVNVVMANLKRYRTKSQLAANDYSKLKSDRKKLASQTSAASSSTASSSSVSSSSSSYSQPESSSSSSEVSSSVTSSSDTTNRSSQATGNGSDNGNDTATSSAASSSSTTHYSSSQSDNGGNDSGAATGATTDQTTGGNTTTGTGNGQ